MAAIAFDAAVAFDSSSYTFDGASLVAAFASGIGEQTVTVRLNNMATVFTDEEAD